MNKRLIRAACFILCLAMLCPVFGAYADDASGRTVRVGYIDYDGFISVDDNGEYEGYGVEYLNKIAGINGWKYEFVYDSWDSLLERVKTGEIDLLCHAQMTEERKQDFVFSRYSSGTESGLLYVRSDDDRYYNNDFKSFDGMTIAFLNRSFQNKSFEAFAAEHGFTYSALYFNTESECFDALDSGTADGVAMGSLAVKTQYRSVSRFGSDPFYFITGLLNRELMSELDGAVSEIMMYDPYFETELYEKHYGSTSAYHFLSFTREQSEYIASSGTITVGLLPGSDPLSYTDKKGNPSGILVDLLDLIALRSGLDFHYVFLSDSISVNNFLSSPGINIVAGLADSELYSIEASLLKSAPLFNSSVVFVGKTGHDFNSQRTLTMAVPLAEESSNSAFERAFPDYEFEYYSDSAACFDAVRRGKADITLADINIARHHFERPLYSSMSIFPTYSYTTYVRAVTSQENPVLISIIDDTVNSLSENTINEILIANTIERASHTNLSDIIYKYRSPLVAILALTLVLALILVLLFKRRKRDLNESEKQNLQLAAAVAQADEANAAKSRFLSNMSHEIRTPLNAIIGLTQISKETVTDRDKLLDYLEKIESSSQMLLSLVNDILDMSAIENNKLKIASEPFNLISVINAVSEVYTVQCEHKGISFKTDTSALRHPILKGDSLRISQILLNLISNAYKFTESGGITLTVSETAQHSMRVFVRFRVSDTGCGMSKDMQKRLFGVFEQESAAIAQKYGGSGLGLSITKSLVSLMHGSIHVDSNKGSGSTFTVDLPFVLAADSHLAEDSARKRLSDYDFSGLRILLAEDNALNTQIAVALLEKTGAQVDTVINGKQALDAFLSSADGTYSLILLDIRMPEMNGYDCARAIRRSEHPQAQSVPILAMTANALTEDVADAISSGMNGHIAKPINTKLLYSAIENSVKD